jgi:hypothetical protein
MSHIHPEQARPMLAIPIPARPHYHPKQQPHPDSPHNAASRSLNETCREPSCCKAALTQSRNHLLAPAPRALLPLSAYVIMLPRARVWSCHEHQPHLPRLAPAPSRLAAPPSRQPGQRRQSQLAFRLSRRRKHNTTRNARTDNRTHALTSTTYCERTSGRLLARHTRTARSTQRQPGTRGYTQREVKMQIK